MTEAWPRVADRVAIEWPGGIGPRRVTFGEVARLTKTLVILEDGQRFNRPRLSEVGKPYGKRLYRPESQRIKDALAELEQRALLNAVRSSLDDAVRAISRGNVADVKRCLRESLALLGEEP